MELLRYSYIIESQFTNPIGYHAFKLRCIPSSVGFQRIVEQHITVSPECDILYSTDRFGNIVLYGSINQPHSLFRVESHGLVEHQAYVIPDATPDDLFLYPSSLATWNEEMKQWCSHLNAEDIMHAVHQYIKYERFVTDNTTTALQVFHERKGVCQDYAHLMVAACRASGMFARYVNGIMTGEGETHAWVEVHDGSKWLGYDPTLDRMTDNNYLKFAHGRDVNDCPTNRGRFYQWTNETMSIHCEMLPYEAPSTLHKE